MAIGEGIHFLVVKIVDVFVSLPNNNAEIKVAELAPALNSAR